MYSVHSLLLNNKKRITVYHNPYIYTQVLRFVDNDNKDVYVFGIISSTSTDNLVYSVSCICTGHVNNHSTYDSDIDQ